MELVILHNSVYAFIAVSYTHLDVYKRQASWFMPANSSNLFAKKLLPPYPDIKLFFSLIDLVK